MTELCEDNLQLRILNPRSIGLLGTQYSSFDRSDITSFNPKLSRFYTEQLVKVIFGKVIVICGIEL